MGAAIAIAAIVAAMAAASAIAVWFFTNGSLNVHKREAAASEQDFVAYKLKIQGKVADAAKAGLEAGRTASDALIKIAEANERAASYEKEAAIARMETEKIKLGVSSRVFSDRQIEIIVKNLKKENYAINIVVRGEDEPSTYASKLISALNAARLLRGNYYTLAPADNWTGINIYVGYETDPDKFNSNPVVKAFRLAGINVGSITGGARSGLVTSPNMERPGEVTVYIGFKPTPDFSPN